VVQPIEMFASFFVVGSMCFQSIFVYNIPYYSLVYVYVWTHFDTHGNQPKKEDHGFLITKKVNQPFMIGFTDFISSLW